MILELDFLQEVQILYERSVRLNRLQHSYTNRGYILTITLQDMVLEQSCSSWCNYELFTVTLLSRVNVKDKGSIPL